MGSRDPARTELTLILDGTDHFDNTPTEPPRTARNVLFRNWSKPEIHWHPETLSDVARGGEQQSVRAALPTALHHSRDVGLDGEALPVVRRGARRVAAQPPRWFQATRAGPAAHSGVVR